MLPYIIFIIIINIYRCNGLFFIVQKEDRKSFTLEQPRDTPIVFSYEIIDDNHEVEFCLYYGTMSLSQLQIMNKTLSSAVGHVDFTADNSGSYTACERQVASDDTEYPTVSRYIIILLLNILLYIYIYYM